MSELPLGSAYLLAERLGSGAMGTVYRGRDKEGRAFAVKVLRPDFAQDSALVQRFVQERSVLTRVEHPNVVRMHDLVVEGETLAIVMDLVEGGDLRGLLRSQGPLPPGQAAGLAGGIAAGLAAVHAAGLVHRDVKPENVLLDGQGQDAVPRVTDFGIARLVDVSASARSTLALGTPNYVAPEIAEGRPATGASDVYSLGIVLYELCAGLTPFEGDSPLAVIRRHAEAQAPRPDGVPDQVWAAIRDMLAKDPDARPTMAQIAPYLANLGVSLAEHPPAPRLTEPLPVPQTVPLASPAPSPSAPVGREGTDQQVAATAAEPPRRRRGALVAGVLVAVLALGGGGYLASRTLLDDNDDGAAAGPDGGDGEEAAAGDVAQETGAAVEQTTGEPTTSQPTTAEPPTSEPSTAEPTTAEPTTEETTQTTQEPVLMPDVVGATLAGARADLRGVTIKVEETLDPDATDKEVVAQSVTAGEEWPEAVTLTVARQPVTVYVDSLSTVDSYALGEDTSELDGESYPRSLASGSWDKSGYGEWNLSRGYRQLVATVGRSDDAAHSEEQVQVEVFLDQRKAWSERVVLGEPVEMDIDVTDVLRLRIEFTSLNDQAAYLVLGDIHLLGLPSEVPELEED